MVEILRPSEGKLFANADETELYSALILAPNDSIENYHEVDELTEIIINEEPEEIEEEEPLEMPELELHPDEQGKISYEEANQLLNCLSMLTRRVINLTDTVNDIQYNEEASEIVDILLGNVTE